MAETAFSDIIARVRRSANSGASAELEAELAELERRARELGATDEELSLAVFALLAANACSGAP